MTATVPLLLPALVLSATIAEARFLQCEPHQYNTLHAQAITDFTMAVNRYAEIRRLLADPMSPLASADLEQAARARRAHRAAILEAHGTLRRGTVFTARVAAHFRCQIELAQRYGGTDVAAMWTAALLALPELPSELEYRVVGRDLVLLDPELNLTVDVVNAAFPADWVEDGEVGSEDSETCAPEDAPIIEGNPCDVHSDLPMCWS
jgi:hypothetical protein